MWHTPVTHPSGSVVKNSSAMQETWVRPLGRSTETLSSIPGGGHGNPFQYSGLENSMTEESGGLQPTGLKRVGHN